MQKPRFDIVRALEVQSVLRAVVTIEVKLARRELFLFWYCWLPRFWETVLDAMEGVVLCCEGFFEQHDPGTTTVFESWLVLS